MILDIVVDVQKDFITGALANPQAQANVTRLAETVKAHARAGHWLFLTRDTHPDNYLATREGRHLPVEHCIEGEDGWNFAPELENALDGTEPEVCHIVNKPTFGSYMLPSEILDELMAHNKAVDDIEKIVIYGYCTDICVISNAMVLRAAFPETEIEILSDCCAGVTPQSHQTALDPCGRASSQSYKAYKGKIETDALLRFSPHCVILYTVKLNTTAGAFLCRRSAHGKG